MKDTFKKAQSRLLNKGQELHKDHGKISLTVNLLDAFEDPKGRAKRKLRSGIMRRQKDMN